MIDLIKIFSIPGMDKYVGDTFDSVITKMLSDEKIILNEDEIDLVFGIIDTTKEYYHQRIESMLLMVSPITLVEVHTWFTFIFYGLILRMDNEVSRATQNDIYKIITEFRADEVGLGIFTFLYKGDCYFVDYSSNRAEFTLIYGMCNLENLGDSDKLAAMYATIKNNGVLSLNNFNEAYDRVLERDGKVTPHEFMKAYDAFVTDKSIINKFKILRNLGNTMSEMGEYDLDINLIDKCAFNAHINALLTQNTKFNYFSTLIENNPLSLLCDLYINEASVMENCDNIIRILKTSLIHTHTKYLLLIIHVQLAKRYDAIHNSNSADKFIEYMNDREAESIYESQFKVFITKKSNISKVIFDELDRTNVTINSKSEKEIDDIFREILRML